MARWWQSNHGEWETDGNTWWWRSQSWGNNWWYDDAVRAATNEVFTGQMCAGQRWDETNRPDAMFHDHLAGKLAGPEGRNQPMGGWILIPRTVYGDEVLRRGYVQNNCRQLVLLGAGMDARAWRLQFPELDVYEVDMQSNFDVKESLVAGHPLTVRSRHVVATHFDKNEAHSTPAWVTDLQQTGFRHDVPTVWLLEGLMMYLSIEDQMTLMKNVGFISAPGSLVFHDAISKSQMSSNIRVADVPFLGGSDEYGQQWHQYGGFKKNAIIRSIESMRVDRVNKRLEFAPKEFAWRYDTSPESLRGQRVTLFVEVEK
eukprot:gnl/MRDRNA2_/MRDRNA2_30186_c0_seq1.p1 gnl/MRDRNA2_/MRDRNA2_30186_c0~~gnl/MRDRNA2_/MRDRNA2_30186_c0_seq1.p1  ORF type:complete len:314 (+),score=62.37 gnl/MRDRNA2_/MRDRNA2_30186_c0_seq1:93-1034(+)